MIDVFVSARRDIGSARRFFTTAMTAHGEPDEVVTDRTASVIIRGHAFIQNLRRGHYELGIDARIRHLRIAAAFDELAGVL